MLSFTIWCLSCRPSERRQCNGVSPTCLFTEAHEMNEKIAIQLSVGFVVLGPIGGSQGTSYTRLASASGLKMRLPKDTFQQSKSHSTILGKGLSIACNSKNKMFRHSSFQHHYSQCQHILTGQLLCTNIFLFVCYFCHQVMQNAES